MVLTHSPQRRGGAQEKDRSMISGKEDENRGIANRVGERVGGSYNFE